jgi:hypothetical protein
MNRHDDETEDLRQLWLVDRHTQNLVAAIRVAIESATRDLVAGAQRSHDPGPACLATRIVLLTELLESIEGVSE